MSERAQPVSLPRRFPCALLRADGEGLIVAANDTLTHLLGCTAKSLVGKPVEAVFTPASAVLFQTHLRPLLELHGQVEEFAMTLRGHARAPGQAQDMLLFAHLSDEHLHIVLAPYRARRSVTEELLRVRRAADQAPGMIFHFTASPDGRAGFPYASEAVRNLYGCTPTELQESAEHLLALLRPTDRARFLEPATLASPTGTVQLRHFVMPVARPSGDLAWHEVHATARVGADGSTVWQGYIADVTQRRQMEALAAAQRAAAQAQQSQTEFLGRVSHELRTPLNAILGFAQLMGSSLQDPLNAGQRQQLGLIQAAGEQLLQLVDEVLDISKAQDAGFRVQLSAARVTPLLEHCVAMAGPQSQQAGVQVLPAEVEHGLTVLVDERRLLQVLNNLVSNAIKYNRRGGEVRLRAIRQGGRACLTVQDSGLGMTDVQRRALFQPFNRLGAEATGVPGTGLGLVIARQLVQRMGGSIQLESMPGVGSAFHVWLPLAANDPLHPEPVDAARAFRKPGHLPTHGAPRAAPGERAHVLYVEDNPVNVLLLEAIAARRPHLELQSVGTAAEALRLALDRPPQLLLLDQHLPDMQGNELLAQLHQDPRLRRVPAVMVSADHTVPAQSAARAVGFCDSWGKPLDLRQVLAGLDALCPPPATQQTADQSSGQSAASG